MGQPCKLAKTPSQGIQLQSHTSIAVEILHFPELESLQLLPVVPSLLTPWFLSRNTPSFLMPLEFDCPGEFSLSFSGIFIHVGYFLRLLAYSFKLWILSMYNNCIASDNVNHNITRLMRVFGYNSFYHCPLKPY